MISNFQPLSAQRELQTSENFLVLLEVINYEQNLKITESKRDSYGLNQNLFDLNEDIQEKPSIFCRSKLVIKPTKRQTKPVNRIECLILFLSFMFLKHCKINKQEQCTFS